LLYGTLPSTYSDYDHYYYKFTDTLATGLTAPSASDVHVKIGGTEYTGANVNINGQTITVEILDVKTASASATKDSVITVEYNATLNANAVIGLDGNENEVYLTYSNNPNNTGDGTAAPSDTGTTVKDKVIVFTYELDATKVDASDNTPLANATFYLKRANASLTSDNDKYEYAKLDDNYKVTGWTTTKESATLLTSRDTADSLEGTFKVIGLDDATYYLEEVTAPTGYNKLTADVPVVISATTANNQAWSGTASAALTALSVSVNENANASAADGTLSDGNVKVTIKNSKGSTLPTTGGIGTTIFYVGGGVVVAGAGVLLVTKKRMRNK
jgi:fimbrial isopeptide formation D2 family protein/LPXTG-motif cell wall-anchored protein